MRTVTLLFFMALMLSGCVVGSLPGHLYPVQGPLAASTPVPTYKVTVNFVAVVGKVSATLPDGVVCRGNLHKLELEDPSQRTMEADWDRVYGSGFFVANILGRERARATLAGAAGECLHLEIFNPHLHSRNGALRDLEGVGRDERGNLFKLTF